MVAADEDLSRAVLLYVGYGSQAAPLSDADRLTPVFAEPLRGQLLGAVRALVAELGGIEVDWSTHSLAGAGEAVQRILRERHPELSDDAVRALAWKWTYDWR